MLSGVDDILHARLFTRAAEGLETDNKFGGDEIDTDGSEDDDEKTTDNTAGTDEMPELEEDDNTNTRGNTFGSDIRQNVTAVKAEIIKLH